MNRGSASAEGQPAESFKGDHETYIVLVAEIHRLQRLPRKALHEMLWGPSEKKAAAQTFFSDATGFSSRKKKKNVN